VYQKCSDGKRNKVRTRNYLSCSFSIENGLEEGDGLSPQLCNFALEFAIRKVNETNLRLDMIGLRQILTYADDINVIADGIRTIERNADVLLNACKDIDLAVNRGKTKYMEIGRHWDVIANEHIKIGSNSYGKSENF